MATADNDESAVSPTARRMVLGVRLRKLREAAGLSRNEAGRLLRGSASKISRMELGQVGFKDIDIRDLLTTYGVHDADQRQVYLDFADEANQTGWWRRYGDVMPDWLDDLVGLEQATSRIQAYELVFVTGLLQTEDYARAISRDGNPSATDDEVEQRVALRLRRQQLLHRPDAPKLWVIMDESVLHRPVGKTPVLRGQIEHLLAVTADLPNISLQVVPNEVSGYAAETPFSLLRFTEPELPNLVYVEYHSNAQYIDDPKETEPHIRAFDRLMVDAYTPDRTRQFLDKLRNELS